MAIKAICYIMPKVMTSPGAFHLNCNIVASGPRKREGSTAITKERMPYSPNKGESKDREPAELFEN